MERNANNWSDYKHQQSHCSNLFKESKTHNFNNLNVKDVTENKRFWKTIKPILTNKAKNSNNITLTENYQTIREDEKICKTFNTYFTNVTKVLKLRQVCETQLFKNKESCRLIQEHYGNEFFFKAGL